MLNGHGRTKLSEVVFVLFQLVSNLTDDGGHVMFDMGEQNTCQFLGEHITSEETRRHSRVNRVGAEVHALLLNGGLDGNLVNNILLSTVLDTNVSHSEGDFLVHDHSLGAHTSVHDIKLGKDTDSADTFGVELTSHLQTIGSGHIGVSRHDTEDNSTSVSHVSTAHIFSNLFNVLVLSGDSDTGNSRKINKSEIRASVREDLKDDRLVYDSLGFSTDLVGESLNGLSDFVEVSEFLSGDFFREHSPRLLLVVQMSKSHFKRTARHDTTSSG